MDGEIDLELYTICIIRLNNALKTINSNSKEVHQMLQDSARDLKEFYLDVVTDLNQNEINYNEYELFFKNGQNSFPEYINILKETLNNNDNSDIKDSLKSLINTFNNLNKIAEGMGQ